MAVLIVTERGQVTFRKDVLRHLGIRIGDRIRIDLLPDGRAQLEADRPKGSWRTLHGMLKGKGNGAQLSLSFFVAACAAAGATAGAEGLPSR